ncbi:hypothetical protein FRB90_002479, partial [Tulasnella sp. 427]
MTLLQASRGALRTVRKHTIGFTNVQSKVLSATENFPLDDAPFVALTHKFEIAQLSWDDDAFEEIVDVLKKRLMGSKWRRVVKALMVLHYCLQEGSGRFTVWCQLNSALLTTLETYEFTLENERDCGIHVRREARKISSLLHDSTFLDMRSHTEGEHLSRQASMHRQEATEEQLQRGVSRGNILKRRGALMGFRRLNRSDMTAATASSNDSGRTLVDTAPVTVKQKVKTAISDTVELNASMDNIKDIARQTTCPSDFLDIMEAILESLVAGDNKRQWGQVLRSIVLLRQCLSNVSNDVATYFQGNEEVMRLLYGFGGLDNLDLLGRTADALRNSLPATVPANEKAPIEVGSMVVPSRREAPPEKAPIVDPPAYNVLNPDDDETTDSPNDTVSQDSALPSTARRPTRPLPTPPAPVDWSRLYTVAAGHRTPSIRSSAYDQHAEKRRASEMGFFVGEPFRPLPVSPPRSADEVLPSYDVAIESPPVEEPLDEGVPASPVGTLVDLEDEIEYVDEEEVDGTGVVEEGVEEDVALGISVVGDEEEEVVATTPPAMSVPPSDSNEETDVSQDNFWPPPRPSISITPSPQPTPSFDSPEAISSSTSSPSPSSLVRCLTGLLNYGSEAPYARGGYSDVWKGRLNPHPTSPSSDGEVVAIKVLRAVRVQSDDRDACPVSRMRKRMTRETSIWSQLVHPNVVPLLGYAFDEHGTPAIVSKWMQNGDVLGYLARHRFADRRKLVRQVADGLGYLHSRTPPVVHGDLKGGNVLVDKRGEAALCDFGMSTLLMMGELGGGVGALTMSSTSSHAAVGTLRWCAPELLSSDVPLKTLATDV